MKQPYRKIDWRALFITMLITLLIPIRAWASDEIAITTDINIDQNCANSEAELVIRITIPEGTPIGSLPEVISELQAFYKEFWTGERNYLESSQHQGGTPNLSDNDQGYLAVIGVDAILAVIRAYHSVEVRGYSVFPDETVIVSKERFPLTIDCLLTENVGDQSSKIESFKEGNLMKMKREQLVQNLNYMSVALVSFRSEFNRFPTNFDELFNSGHVLLSLKNPFTGGNINVSRDLSPGNIIYSRPSEGRYSLTVVDLMNVPIKRELIAGPSVRSRGLLSYDKPPGDDPVKYSNQERTVRIYIFQIGNLLNSFYETFNYLPDSIPHIESQGHAPVGFINPFTNKPIKPVLNINSSEPGNYSYWKIGDTEYLLVGYGAGGRKVIEIHRRFIGDIE